MWRPHTSGSFSSLMLLPMGLMKTVSFKTTIYVIYTSNLCFIRGRDAHRPAALSWHRPYVLSDRCKSLLQLLVILFYFLIYFYSTWLGLKSMPRHITAVAMGRWLLSHFYLFLFPSALLPTFEGSPALTGNMHCFPYSVSHLIIFIGVLRSWSGWSTGESNGRKTTPTSSTRGWCACAPSRPILKRRESSCPSTRTPAFWMRPINETLLGLLCN